VALRAFPALHRFVLGRTVFGSFLSELAERRIPLLLSPAKDITWADVYRLVEDFPRLTCVICDVGTWGVNRYTWPLLEAFPNVYLETSMLSLADGDLEATVGKFGAGRLLFGSGFPERYPEAAILQLLHAEIADEDKARIASGNMRALIGNVKL
jgi:predicted TIM-barrel fold metal-dependent hydrolase